METEEVKNLITEGLSDAEVVVEGEGCNFSVVVTSTGFEGLSLLERQKRVLGAVEPAIATGALHAITVKAYTPGERDARQATAS